MKNTKIKIKIEFTDTEEAVNSEPLKLGDGNFEIIFSQDKKNLIDRSEQALLHANSVAIRNALEEYLSELSKKSLDVTVTKDINIEEKYFRVDGEAGRFTFKIYNTQNPDDNLFPALKGKEFYKTVGFKELAYYQGSCDKSYRKTTELLNRVRYQEEGGTPYRTVNSGVTQEARAINEKISKKADEILQKNNFTDSACPKEQISKNNNIFHTIEKVEIQNKLNELKAELPDKKLSKNLTIGNVKFEDPENTTNISIDDVCVKEQKTERENKKSKQDKENISEQTKETHNLLSDKKKKRNYTYNTVAHIENGKGQYSLVGQGVASIFVIIVSFILHNELLNTNWIFFLDGQRSLYTTIIESLFWKSNYGFILDWYHLKKKCETQLSLAMNDRKKRNEILGKILYYSWYGCIEKVYEVIDNIPKDYIKNQDALRVLKGYYERNNDYIPNYALRKKLGLRNSSNRVEKENDILIADRQKKNGMSWSKLGSNSLGILTSIKKNKETKSWLNNADIEFKIVA